MRDVKFAYNKDMTNIRKRSTSIRSDQTLLKSDNEKWNEPFNIDYFHIKRQVTAGNKTKTAVNIIKPVLALQLLVTSPSGFMLVQQDN